jgi:hypothetical protein
MAWEDRIAWLEFQNLALDELLLVLFINSVFKMIG